MPLVRATAQPDNNRGVGKLAKHSVLATVLNHVWRAAVSRARGMSGGDGVKVSNEGVNLSFV